MKNFSVLDIFCGAGGFSEGFREAGFKIVAGIDNDPQALLTYSANFPDALTIRKDLSRIPDVEDLEYRELFRKRIDVLIGGPPCQGFSIAGKRMKDDPRNKLYKAYLALIATLKPSVLVVENVPTILTLFHGEVSKQIKEDFRQAGYETTVFTLLASDYGIPQNRKRVFFVAEKVTKKFKIPAPAPSYSKVTAEMAISDLPLLDQNLGGEEADYYGSALNSYQRELRKGSDKLFNHWAVVHTKKTKEIISLVPDGGNYKDLPEHLQDTRRVHIAWTRMNSRKPCFTIDAGHNHHFHYKANRVPTVRECARIQSFPDKFRFLGNKTSQFRQVGNAVPPALAKIIALEIRRALL